MILFNNGFTHHYLSRDTTKGLYYNCNIAFFKEIPQLFMLYEFQPFFLKCKELLSGF